MNRGLLLYILFFPSFISAMEKDKTYLDSLYTLYTKNYFLKQQATNRPAQSKEPISKCLTPLNVEVMENFNRFTPEQQSVLKKANERPVCDTSFVTPQKHFRVHFYKSGEAAPAYDINEFAKALDSSYNFEVNFLNYPPPPADNGRGGDDLYDVFVVNTFSSYGGTTPEEALPSNGSMFTSYIQVHNSFKDFWTEGIEAARVTAAHELHHAIQMGNYGYRTDMIFFMEITATSMEEFVYNDVNDYYNYLPSFFEKPYNSFIKFVPTTFDGYQLAIWNFFQKKKFGYDIIKREWELIKQFSPLEAIDIALKENNSSFIEAYNEFGVWCCFTNYRSVKDEYFDEAEYYPLIKPFYQIESQSNTFSASLSAYPASDNFLAYINPSKLDTLIIVITNGDIAGANQNWYNGNYKCTFNLYNIYSTGMKKIGSRFFSKLDYDNSVWLQSEILNGQVNNGNIAELPSVDYPFPSPFSYKSNSMVYLPITNADAGLAEIFVYNSAMTLVYSTSQEINKYLDKKCVKWDVKDNSGAKLPSGVYLYAVKTRNEVIKGKIAVIN